MDNTWRPGWPALAPEYPFTPQQTGWVCPKCGRANAPWLSYCGCIGKQVMFIGIDPAVPPDGDDITGGNR